MIFGQINWIQLESRPDEFLLFQAAAGTRGPSTSPFDGDMKGSFQVYKLGISDRWLWFFDVARLPPKRRKLYDVD